jgi:hypothetical protein
MVYGMFFLPLASLAREQCYRVLEAGARKRCAQLGLPTKNVRTKTNLPDRSFSESVLILKKAGRIPQSDLDAWVTMPFFRNRFSHPTSQSISSRELAVETVAFTAELLNRLFR